MYVWTSCQSQGSAWLYIQKSLLNQVAKSKLAYHRGEVWVQRQASACAHGTNQSCINKSAVKEFWLSPLFATQISVASMLWGNWKYRNLCSDTYEFKVLLLLDVPWVSHLTFLPHFLVSFHISFYYLPCSFPPWELYTLVSSGTLLPLHFIMSTYLY